MEQEVIRDDVAKLEPYFAELKSWPSSFTITAEMWPVLSQRVKDALEADIVEAGYALKYVWSVEYKQGKLDRLTVVI